MLQLGLCSGFIICPLAQQWELISVTLRLFSHQGVCASMSFTSLYFPLFYIAFMCYMSLQHSCDQCLIIQNTEINYRSIIPNAFMTTSIKTQAGDTKLNEHSASIYRKQDIMFHHTPRHVVLMEILQQWFPESFTYLLLFLLNFNICPTVTLLFQPETRSTRGAPAAFTHKSIITNSWGIGPGQILDPESHGRKALFLLVIVMLLNQCINCSVVM